MDRNLRSQAVGLLLIAGLLATACPPAPMRAQQSNVGGPLAPAQTASRTYLPLLATPNTVEPDRFAISIGDTVSDGVPAPGAGNIERPAGTDSYTFAAEPGQQVILDVLSSAPGLASTRWRLTAAGGGVVFDRTLGDTGLVTLADGGAYTLVVGDEASAGTGAYAFTLIGLALPGRFAIAIGDIVSDGAPAPGAGNIEAPFSKDIYTFTASAGQRVLFDLQNVAATLSEVRWRLVAPNGSVVFDKPLGYSGGFDPGVFTLPAAGVYALVVGADTNGGIGTYGLQLRTPPAPQQFAIAIGDTVSDGAPAPGAGNIEEPFAQDVYSFTGAAGQRVILDLLSAAGALGEMNWRLVAPGGGVVFDRSFSPGGPQAYTLPAAGAYAIVVGDDTEGSAGAYSFQLRAAPAPQQFAIAIGDTVSDGAPAPGAGNIEAPFAQDVYSFTGAAGQRVIFDLQNTADTLQTVALRLVAPDGSGVEESSRSPGFPFILTLPAAGVYALTVGAATGAGTGDYTFQLNAPPAPQQFAIAIGDTVSDGAPAPGAGNIEAPFAQDVYSFTGAAGQPVIVDVQEDELLGEVGWRLVAPDGSVLVQESVRFSVPQLRTLPAAGTYTLLVGGGGSGDGTYQIRLATPPAPQQFAIAIGDTVSDGVPGPGAGNIEADFGQDIYSFTATAGQRVFFALDDTTGSLSGVSWRLAAPDGSLLLSSSLAFRSLFDYQLRAAGTYTLLVGGGSSSGTGTYELGIGSVPAPQEFAIAIGDTVSDGAPAPGAGNIEAPFGQDIYSFTATAGQRVFFELENDAGGPSGLRWRLVAPNGNILLERPLDFSSSAVRTLRAAGTYSLLVVGDGDSGSSTYQLRLGSVPAPQEFAIAIGDTVSDGAPAPGAGNIEAPYGQDVYSFTGAAGQPVIFDFENVAGALSEVSWRLVAPDGGILINTSLGLSGPSPFQLRAIGTYTILVGGDRGPGTGAYELRLGTPPAPQTFAISIGETVSDGVPAPGAGKIEAPFGRDIYTFTGAAGQRVFIELDNETGSLDGINWQLLAPNGSLVVDRPNYGSSSPLYTLRAAGSYTFIVGSDFDGGTGTYELRIGAAPAPQQFAIAVGATVSDGVPAPGAGNIEAPFGQDVYSFTATAGQRVRFEALAATVGYSWQLVAPDRSVIFDTLFASFFGLDEQEHTLPATGTYTLTVGSDFRPDTSTYSFRTSLQ